MTAKQYLRQAYRLNELINSDIRELERLKEMSKSISTPNLTGMPSGGRKQEAPFVDALVRIAELENVINAEIDRYVAVKMEIREAINRVSDNNQRLILRLRYIQFLSWDEVAAGAGLSLKHVYRIHDRALRNVRIPNQNPTKVGVNETKCD